jgi:hypothetical protein
LFSSQSMLVPTRLLSLVLLGAAGRVRAVTRDTSCSLILITSLEWLWSILFCLRKGPQIPV